MGTGSFQEVKRPGRGVNHPPQTSAEVKERVELYLYFPSGTLWPVLRWTLPFVLHFDQYCCSPRDYLIKNYSCIKYALHISIWLHNIIIDAVHLCTARGGNGKVLPLCAMKVCNKECRGIVAPILNLGGEYATLGPGCCTSWRAWYPLRRQGGS
jgi:hypothetical protein